MSAEEAVGTATGIAAQYCDSLLQLNYNNLSKANLARGLLELDVILNAVTELLEHLGKMLSSLKNEEGNLEKAKEYPMRTYSEQLMLGEGADGSS